MEGGGRGGLRLDIVRHLEKSVPDSSFSPTQVKIRLPYLIFRNLTSQTNLKA